MVTCADYSCFGIVSTSQNLIQPPKNHIFRHRTVGRGFIENVRYELLFALNNHGPSFQDGMYIGPDIDADAYMDGIAQKMILDFDRRIVDIEKLVNKVYAFQWLPKSEDIPQGQSCLQDSPSAMTCTFMALGDYQIPTCEICDAKLAVNRLYDLTVKTTGDHVDPRLDEKSICWPHFGNRLKIIFEKVKNRAIARVADWKKIAHITRALLMHNLTVLLTEIMLKSADTETFGNTNFIPELMGRNRVESFMNVQDNEDIPKIINDLVIHLMPDGYSDELPLFDSMTTVEGVLYRRNEREDYRYTGVDYEKDDYIGLQYTYRTPHAGEVYGRVAAGRKTILFNPLNSGFIEQLIYENSERDCQRLATMGVNVGQIITFPTRHIRSERRCMYWDILSGWPACDHTEGRQVNDTETRYKCSVPAPMCLVNQGDVITIMNEIGSPIEFV